MENEKQILVVGRDECFGIAYALATSLGKSFIQSHEVVNIKDGLVLQIQATGYDFGIEASRLADYLIEECDNFNFNNQSELNYADFLNAYISQHPQYIEDCKREFKGIGANRAAILLNAGKMEVGKYKSPEFPTEKWSSFRPNGNQKWYNQFPKRRKR